MKKAKLLLGMFTLALVIGLALAVTIPEPTNALWCPIYSPGMYQTNTPCTCANMEEGYVVEKWRGFWEDGSYCGFYTYCSACPPHTGKGPYPKCEVPNGG